MRYRTFGRLGWQVSEIGFGGWAIGGDWGKVEDSEALATLHEALDSGINFIDTAQGYGDGHSEELIGRVLAERGSGAGRVYVATKIPPAGKLWWVDPDFDDIGQFYPPAYLRERVELSLKRLGTEAVDLMQLHTWTAGFNQHDEWYETLESLRREGKLHGFGISASEKRPGDVVPSVEAGRLDSVQVIYNLFEQRTARSVLEPCGRHHTAAIVRVPLDEGSLTGKFSEKTTFAKGDFRRHFFRGNNLKATLRRVGEIKRFKDEHYPGLSLVELALLFCKSHPDASTV
ncbi:MAG: aldo/keto reductase, partial [Candidatus Glassbacteria bacterium]|nr:aldo/keto reductase [Candidatus Glassbacteria bacterium]